MRCYEIQDLLTEFIEGSLPVEQTREVVDHIARCKACERDVTRMENLVASLRALPPIAPPERLRAGIADAVRGVSQQQTARVQPLRRRYMWLGGGLGAAAAAAVFLGIVFGLRPALFGRGAPDQIASAGLSEEEAQQDMRVGQRMPRNGSVVELAPDGEFPADELEEELEGAEGESDDEGEDTDGLSEFAFEGALPPELTGPGTIQKRADALNESLLERRGGLAFYDLEPAPEPSEPGPRREAATAPAAPAETLAIPAAKARAPSTAPPPPSTRARGLWAGEGEGRSVARAPSAAMAERAEGEDERAPNVAAAPGIPSGGGLGGSRAVATEPGPRIAFGKTSELQIELRRGGPLRARETGELLVTVHADSDVEDARITLDAPDGVQLGGGYGNGEVFRGRLGKDMTKTIRVPIIPQEPGTKTFSAQARRGDRDTLLSVAQFIVPVEAAAAGPAGAQKGLHTLTFDRVGLHTALRQAAAEAGAKVQIDARVQDSKVAYAAVARPIDEIMKALAAKGDCQAALKGDVWHISPRSGGQ
jgi:hypothetical protein